MNTLINDYSTLVEETGRKLDYCLIKNLDSNYETQIIKELKKFQNRNGGFGNSLEPDIRLPFSNVASTDVAVTILEAINDTIIKEPVIKLIVKYYEEVFDYENYEFLMVPKEVDMYPRAVWWNFDGVRSFTFLNPNPEICGFLNQYKEYLTKIDIVKFTNKVLKEINDNLATASMHSVISVLYFYQRMDLKTKMSIKYIIQEKIDTELIKSKDKPDEYNLEPYMVYIISNEFFVNSKEELKKNYLFYNGLLDNKQLIKPKWHWYQYEEVFENIASKEWVSYLTYNVLCFVTKYK